MWPKISVVSTRDRISLERWMSGECHLGAVTCFVNILFKLTSSFKLSECLLPLPIKYYNCFLSLLINDCWPKTFISFSFWKLFRFSYSIFHLRIAWSYFRVAQLGVDVKSTQSINEPTTYKTIGIAGHKVNLFHAFSCHLDMNN